MRSTLIPLSTSALILCLCVRAVAYDRNPDDIAHPHPPAIPPSPTNSPLPSPAIIADNVFVPLQKWKEQKIQDIESRVKKDKQLHDVNKNNNNLHNNRITSHPKASRLRYHYPNNFSVTRRQFLFTQIFSSTCPFHPSSTLSTMPASSTYSNSNSNSHTPVPAPYNPPVLQEANPAAASFSEKPNSNSDADVSVNSADESPAPLLKTIGNKVRKLRDSVSSTISVTATANVSAAAAAHFSPAESGNPSEPNNNNISSSPAAHPSAIATPTTTPTILPSYTHLSPAIDSPNAHSIAPSVATDDNAVEQQPEDNIPPPAAASTISSSQENHNHTPRPAPIPQSATVPSTTTTTKQADEVAHAASAPVVLNRKSFNFASQGAGAQILAASANAVGAKNIIVENDDKYMLAPCDDTTTGGGYRWVDIELSEYVIMESVQTGNFEHYSSAARKFAVLGSEHYPPKQWNTLGVFDFKDTRGIQTFNITYKSTQERKVSRFLRVVYAGKRGYEYYCPISIFRAFGKNLIADLKDGLETPLKEQEHPPKNNEKQNDKGNDAIKINKSIINFADEHRMLLEDNLTSLEQNAKFEADVASIESEKGNNQHGNPQERDGAPANQDASDDRKNEADKSPDGSKDQQKSGDNNKSSGNDNADGNANVNGNSDEVKAEPRAPKADISTDDQIVLDVVREETLSPVSGNDNIFRRVARMIRLLELNQSLTNQYIDTQLARFAQALAGTQTEQGRITENHQREIARTHTQLNDLQHMQQTQIERCLRELHSASWRRDILTCALVVVIGILCGTNWIMWTAIVAMRNVGTEHANIHGNDSINTANGNNADNDVTSPISSPDGSTLTREGRSNAGTQVNGNAAGSSRAVSTISTISTTASVDGVHVQMTDVRHTRRRRRRRWTEPGTSANGNSNSGRPPIGNSPSRRHRAESTGNDTTAVSSPSRRSNNQYRQPVSPFVSNSFHPLTAPALLEYEQHDVPPE